MKNKKFIDGFILRFSMVLMAIFVCGFAFISCEPTMDMVGDVTQPTTPTTPEPTTPTTPEPMTPTTPEPTTPTPPTEQGTQDLVIGGGTEGETGGDRGRDRWDRGRDRWDRGRDRWDRGR